MPISKFAVKIGRALVEYLETDNTSTLPAGYVYRKDNSAVLSHYTAGNLTSTAVGLASTAVTGAARQAMYSFGFWATPTAASPSVYNAPGIASYLSVPGAQGVDRALQIAKLFDLIKDDAQGKNLVEILQTQTVGRRSDLIGNTGFNLIDPGNQYENAIITSDCDKILEFITHPDKWHEKTSGRRVLEVIRLQLDIHSADVEEEKRILTRIVAPVSALTQGTPRSANLYSAHEDSQAPEELRTPENALLKLIYDRTVELKQSLAYEILSSTQHPVSRQGGHRPSWSRQQGQHSSFRQSSSTSLTSPNNASSMGSASSSSNSAQSQTSASGRSHSSQTGFSPK